MTIKAAELAKQTGASYRQIDHWCSLEIICTASNHNPGSGFKREFDEEIVDRVALLVRMSRAFSHHIHGSELKKVYDAYEIGFVVLGDGITLSWR